MSICRECQPTLHACLAEPAPTQPNRSKVNQSKTKKPRRVNLKGDPNEIREDPETSLYTHSSRRSMFSPTRRLSSSTRTKAWSGQQKANIGTYT
jgi:hypothetical protein